jgi:hypothetical protein
MQEISSGVAFWILDVWRRMSAQLQLVATDGTDTESTPASIWWTSPIDSIIFVVNMGAAGQNKEWRIPAKGSKFSFGVPHESALSREFTKGIWLSQLLIELPDGKTLLFAERFVEP